MSIATGAGARLFAPPPARPRFRAPTVVCKILGLVLCLGIPLLTAVAAPETGLVKVQVLDEHKAPIAKAICNLTGATLPTPGLQILSGDQGGVEFPGLLWGTYTVACAAVGYRTLSQSNLVLSPQQPVAQVDMVLPAEEVSHQQVEVHASVSNAPQEETGSTPAKITGEQLLTLPLAEMSFKAAIPLVPGVVRLPNGKINIKGEEETEGLVLVDSMAMVDPVTGSFSVDVPIEDIESMQVYKSPFLAEYGGFSGGLTVIDTKPPSDQWLWELNDVIPNPFIEQGHIQGIADSTPRFYLTGPLVKNKVSISESFRFDIHKTFIEGLPWPHNLERRQGFSSFTALQFILSSRHLLTINGRVFPTKTEYANIDTLIPQSASANYGQQGYAIGGTDRFLVGSGGVLTSTFEMTQFDTNAYGQGAANMLVTPNGFGGDYFNIYTRKSNQQQFEETYQFPRPNWHGTHQIQAGIEYFRRNYSGTSDSHPIMVTDANGNTLESITFSPTARLSATDAELGGFAQDHWVMNNRFSVDAGLRFGDETVGTHAAFAPRLGFAYSPTSSGRTVIHGGFGIFYNREPLLATDYPANPIRTIDFFEPNGNVLIPPMVLPNLFGIPGATPGTYLPALHRPSTTPYDKTFNLEFDQVLHPGWILHLSYLPSYGRDEFVVNPQTLAGTTPGYFLTHTGSSHYSEFVSTLRIRPGEKVDMNFSYVYSRARGVLNSLSEVYVPFERPIIQPDAYTNLPSDIPNRFITWSEFRLPGAMMLSPIFDIHSGYPYSQIDVLQNYVGVPDALRYPFFYSFDIKWTKEFHMTPLPGQFFKKHIFRAGFGVFDITNHLNPLDVYNNTASPYFGSFTGFQHRTFATYFDMVK